jgi:hypothetical protein
MPFFLAPPFIECIKGKKKGVLLVPRNFSRGRGVIPSLAEQGEQSCQRGYYQFGMLRLRVRSVALKDTTASVRCTTVFTFPRG